MPERARHRAISAIRHASGEDCVRGGRARAAAIRHASGEGCLGGGRARAAAVRHASGED